MTEFKVAYEVNSADPESPYLIKVAVPNPMGTFSVHEFKFSGLTNAVELLSLYINEYHKRPESIYHFHKTQVEKVNANMELPFLKK